MNSGPHRFLAAQHVEPTVIKSGYMQLYRDADPLARVPRDKRAALYEQIADLCDGLTRRYGDSARKVLAFHYLAGSTDPEGSFAGLCTAVDLPAPDHILGQDGHLSRLLAQFGVPDPVRALVLPDLEGLTSSVAPFSPPSPQEGV